MKKLFYILPLFLFFAFTMHKFHLSNTKVVFNTKEQAVQITMRYFIDDIETAINEQKHITLELGAEKESQKATKILKNYLLSNFKITINKKPSIINYIGNEAEKDIIYFYLEIDSISNINEIKIENKMLIESFSDQQNIIKLIVHEQKKTFVLKKGATIDAVKF